MTFRTASVYIWIIVLLGGVELALECRGHYRGWDAPLFRAAAISTKAVGEEKPARYGPTREFPFRSEIVSRERPADTSRLWVASASHAEDVRLSVEETFPGQAAHLLNRTSKRHWQVLNASRSGNLIATNTADLSRLGARWQPSVVVLYQMSIDIVDLSRQYLGATKPSGKPSRQGDESGEAVPESALRKAAAETTTYTTLKANVTPWIAGQRVLADDLGDAAEHDFERRIRNFLHAVRESGALAVLTTFATSHGKEEAGRLPLSVRQFMLRYNRYLSPEGWVRSVARFNGIVRHIASEEGVVLVDCEQAMTSEVRYFRDYVHFTPAGHKKVAELLSEKLRGVPLDTGHPYSELLPEGRAGKNR
ncbi:MAG TPA: hypothetical protein VG826_32395 [Pirellulales bacterium]|nr:hypothetical protein [Pirellulales bacterium]